MSTMTKDKTLHFKNQWIYKAYKNDSITLTFFILNRKAQYIPAKRKKLRTGKYCVILYEKDKKSFTDPVAL